MRKLLVTAALAMGVVTLGAGQAFAQTNTDSNTVMYTISAVSLIDISGDVNLTVDAVNSVGGGLASDSDSTTYAITNNVADKKLVGKLSSAMPSGATLSVNLAAPSGATSIGTVVLTASDQDLVTGIGSVDEAGLNMTFTLSATVSAALVSAATKNFTLTLIDTP